MSLKKIIQFSNKDLEIKQEETVYQGYFKIKCFHFRHRLFAQGWTPIVKREVLESGNAVGVLAYDPLLNKVVLIQQFRIGAFKDEESPWLLEIIAGSVDSNNSYEQTAHREAKEEAGLELLELHHICEYWTAPAGLTQKVHLFCARVDAQKVNGIYGLKDEDEDIKVSVVQITDAFNAVKNGEIKSAHAIIALQWLELNLEQLRKQWCTSSS
ncbi:MAG: NUDIX domain-containing protein [Tatlockia sp.]|nr:NUDIX domain-containing protein [Tatlockia sp.]